MTCALTRHLAASPTMSDSCSKLHCLHRHPSIPTPRPRWEIHTTYVSCILLGWFHEYMVTVCVCLYVFRVAFESKPLHKQSIHILCISCMHIPGPGLSKIHSSQLYLAAVHFEIWWAPLLPASRRHLSSPVICPPTEADSRDGWDPRWEIIERGTAVRLHRNLCS